MALVNLPGSALVPIGAGHWMQLLGVPINIGAGVMDAANESIMLIGHMVTSDGASHTIDTTGSSAIDWRTGATTTFANAGTTVKVGIAAVDATTGPVARASNVADVISFDVSKSHVGGDGSISASAFITSVPDTGTKTIANGDLVAICMQMTARGGVDDVRGQGMSMNAAWHLPSTTNFSGGVYTVGAFMLSAMVTFSDGALGYIHGTESGLITTRTWNSGSAQAEYGQLFQMPFGMKVAGIYGWIDPDANCDIVLYSAPLGTPVAEKTVTIDANQVASASGRRFNVLFPAPYTVLPNQPIVVAFKPGASNVSAYYKTLSNAAFRVTDPYGTSGYGVQRTTGAFSNSNSSLDHYYIGLLVSALENPVQPIYQLGI